MILSSGKQIYCGKCHKCVISKVKDLNKARCKRFSSVQSLSETILAWDEASASKPDRYERCRVSGGDYGLFYGVTEGNPGRHNAFYSLSDQKGFMSNCDGSSAAGSYGEFKNAALYIRSDPDADLAMLGALSVEQDDRPKALSCSDVLAQNSEAKSGFYPLDPDGLGGHEPFHAYCDMHTAGGGWTLIANREDGSPLKMTTEPLSKEMLTQAMDDKRFMLFKHSVTEVLQLSSGLQEECDNCSPCIMANIQDLNNALCKKFSEVQSLGEGSLAWDQTVAADLSGSDGRFTASLGSFNGVAGANIEFKVARLPTPPGKKYTAKDLYADLMITICKKYGMKPVCDHQSYCKSDPASIYLGQMEHLSYPPHRNDANKNVPGFGKIASKWKGLCNYAGKHDNMKPKPNSGLHALCNVPANTHSWQTPTTANPGFMCARKLGNPITCSPKGVFSARLGAKNGLDAHVYDFKVAYIDKSQKGTYSEGMIAACKQLGMKPVCDHQQYCRKDQKALYIGQTHHISHGGRYGTGKGGEKDHATGFETIKKNFIGHCYYAGTANKGMALCQNGGSHRWVKKEHAVAGFVCGKRSDSSHFFGEATSATSAKDTKNHNGFFYYSNSPSFYKTCNGASAKGSHGIFQYTSLYVRNVADGKPFSAQLVAMNGVSSGYWQFMKVSVRHSDPQASFSRIMREICAAHSMKPVCDHPAYCAPGRSADSGAVYLGQNGHLRYSQPACPGTGMAAAAHQCLSPTAAAAHLRTLGFTLLLLAAFLHCSYPPHRNSKAKGYKTPKGFELIRDKWQGLCSYTGDKRVDTHTKHALCNIPGNTHSWQTPVAGRSFMCGKKDQSFGATLEGKNGIAPGQYEFQIVKLKSKSGHYSPAMIK
eukprot:COSAG05_NODE_1918_length_3836_cov_4.174333_1_plen_875_part_10